MKGFEQYTEQLTDEEIRIANRISITLSKKIGKNNAVTNKTMRQGMKDKWNIELSDAKIRKIINYIRINKLVTNLVATSSGYFVASNKKELDDYLESLIQRRNSIDAVIRSFKETNVEQSNLFES